MALPEKKQASLEVILSAVIICALTACLSATADEMALPPDLQQKILLGNHDEALPELRALEAAGDAEAKYQLALLYLKGTGVERSVPKATNMLRQASEVGHAKAGYLLGNLYFRGRDVPQDTKAAKYYLFAASQQGHQLAGRLLKEIDSQASAPVRGDGRVQERFMLAARSGDRASAELAIRQGARINQADSNGELPLMLAIRNRQEEFALWLLDVGATSDTHDGQGNTALLVAIRVGLNDLARRLIATGAIVEIPNNDGRTPLMEAVNAQHSGLVQALLEAGAAPDIKDKQGMSARKLADFRDSKQIKDLFAGYQATHGSDGDGGDKLALVRRQVGEQGNLYYRWPPLAAAVAQRETQTARELLSAGADPWAVTPNNTNAIAIAITNGDETLAGLMMHSRPIRTVEQDRESLKLMAMAAATDRRTLIEDLINLVPAEGNTTVPLVQTPLWIAIDRSHVEAALTLTSWQAPDKRSDKLGRNLLLFASERGLTDVVRILLRQGFDVTGADDAGRASTWYAAENGFCRLLLALVDSGADIDQSDHNGHTPLIRAVVRQHKECVAIAIAAGSKLDHQTRSGNTALIMAAQSHPESLRIILDADADVSIRNEASFTALMTAVRERCIECIAYLISAGANPRRQNSRGENCYDIAAGDETILAILES